MHNQGNLGLNLFYRIANWTEQKNTCAHDVQIATFCLRQIIVKGMWRAIKYLF